MFGCVFFVIIAVAVVFFIANASTPSSDFDRLVATGIPAIGVLLQVSARPTMTTTAGLRRFQQRSITVDVEIPGHPPYVVSLGAWIPGNLVRDVLPGATVELRVDPKNRNKIMIVGPGVGFAGTSLVGGQAGPMSTPGGMIQGSPS